ncbi:hypothetical protein NXV35_21500 [Bacteroides faecis]|nr:hypothetical protein [Bacteroides faecis]
MAKYYIDYTISYRMEEVEKAIVEASSLSAAKKTLKENLKAEYEGDFLKVEFNDAYRTSDDVRAD